jgi:hypothetical protein
MKAFSVIFFLLGIVSALYEGFHLTAHFSGERLFSWGACIAYNRLCIGFTTGEER